METFLDEVSKKILDRVDSISDCIIILPNNRSKLCILNSISKIISKPIISPQTFTISEFISELSDSSEVDKLRLIFDFYDIYKSNTPKSETDNFENFLIWAPTLLSDFNKLDSYLVNTEIFFKDLISYHELTFWDPKIRFKFNLNFWERLPKYYEALKKKLSLSKFKYKGLIYREAINSLPIYIESIKKKHFFVGFNALNNAEIIIFQEFLESGLAEIYWDIDKLFINNQYYLNGHFIRKYLKDWNHYKRNKYNFFCDTFSSSKNIEIVGFPDEISQSKYVGQKISEYHKISKSGKTAIILADESLLIPVLSGFSNEIKKFNVTMGYNLKLSPLYSFFNLIIDLHQESKDSYLNCYNILKILNHGFIKELLKKNQIIIKNLVDVIKNHNVEYIPFTEIKKIIKGKSKILDLIFKKNTVTTDLINNFFKMISEFKKNQIVSNQFLLLPYFHDLFKSLKKTCDSQKIVDSFKILRYCFDQFVEEKKVNFSGSLDDDVQVMGILESRNLDFENVIVTGLNEGIFPKLNQNYSFFSNQIRKEFNLPVDFDNDAIYSYHFYHLLQRSKNISLLYINQVSSLSSGEKSRFLYQIEYDKLKKHNLKSSTKSLEVFPLAQEERVIEKNQSILNQLKLISSKGFSATSIHEYLKNQIGFYDKRILKIDDKNNMDFSVSDLDKGTLIHKCLEDLYRPYLMKILNLNHIDKIISSVEKILNKNIKNLINLKPDLLKGSNLLLFENIKVIIKGYLNFERELIKKGHEIKIIELENFFEFKLNSLKYDFPVKIIGVIDRVDLFDGEIRIIDYKSGLVEKKDLVFKDFLELKNEKSAPLFQLLLYAYISKKKLYKSKKIIGGIISLRNTKNYFLKLDNYVNINSNYVDEKFVSSFEIFLKKIFDELFDITKPFTLN